MFGFYVIVWISIIAMIVLYAKVRKGLAKELGQDLSVLNRLFMYPGILICVFTIITIYRITEIISPDSKNTLLAIFALIFWGLQGFLYALVYGLTDVVRYNVFGSCGGAPEEDDEGLLEGDRRKSRNRSRSIIDEVIELSETSAHQNLTVNS